MKCAGEARHLPLLNQTGIIQRSGHPIDKTPKQKQIGPTKDVDKKTHGNEVHIRDNKQEIDKCVYPGSNPHMSPGTRSVCVYAR